MNTALFLLISFILTASGGILSHSNTKDRISPERLHKIFIDSSNGTEISGSFDISYEIDSGVKIGCRGGIQAGQEEVSELYVEDEGGLHRIEQSSLNQRSKLRLLVIPDFSRNKNNKFREGDQSIENLGLDHFRLWPRECVLGLLRYRIDDLVAEESHRDAESGFLKVKTYRVAPHLDKEARLLWWRWNWLSAILGIGNGDDDGDGNNGGGQCQTCATWGGGGAIQGGNNNDQACNYFNITISKGGEVSVQPRPPAEPGQAPHEPPREEFIAEEPLEQITSLEIDENSDGISSPLVEFVKSTNDSNLNEKSNDINSDQTSSSPSPSGPNSKGSGSRVTTPTYPTITVTVGGGGGGGGGGDLSPGGSGGDAAGMTIASANSNLNSGFYGCNNDNIVFYGPNINGIRNPCSQNQLMSTQKSPLAC